MKFYTNKNIFKFILLIGAASLVAFASRQALGTIQESRDAKSFDVDQYLKQEQEAIIAELEACGFSQEFITKQRTELLQDYINYDPYKNYFSNEPISEGTKKLVQEVCAAFGVDSSTLPLQSIKTKHSPAAASDRGLYINDALFQTFSPAAQAFIIAHELQHFIFKDDSYCFILETLLTQSNNKKHAQLFDRISRFIEMRADLMASSKSQIYALGQKEACTQFLTMHGDNMGDSHPSNSVRIAMADQILATVA